MQWLRPLFWFALPSLLLEKYGMEQGGFVSSETQHTGASKMWTRWYETQILKKTSGKGKLLRIRKTKVERY